MASGDLVLFTDGGSSAGTVAAAACIIASPDGSPLRGLVALLGEATNNESEIFASLIGFAWIRAHAPECSRVRWVADSEYTLKSGTGYIKNWQKNGWKTAEKKPVKNQGLWRTFLAFTGELTLAPEHVRGHTGHPENETCDEALNWAKMNGSAALGRELSVPVEISDLPVEASWLLCDARGLIRQLRNDHPGEGDFDDLRTMIAESAGAVPPAGALNAPQKRRTDPLKPLVQQLERALDLAASLAREHESAARVRQQLEAIVTTLRSSAT